MPMQGLQNNLTKIVNIYRPWYKSLGEPFFLMAGNDCQHHRHAVRSQPFVQQRRPLVRTTALLLCTARHSLVLMDSDGGLQTSRLMKWTIANIVNGHKVR